MRTLAELAALSWEVIVIGGGCTGAGILRDLSMRGVKALLLEQGDMCNGASSRFHGLLHCGARYAVSDASAGAECIRENCILKRIGAHCVEKTEGLFVLTPDDDPSYEPTWVESCAKCGIPVIPLTRRQALELEPNLNPNLISAYRVPDSAVDGFRLVWQNVFSAKRHGGEFRTQTEVIGFLFNDENVAGVRVRDRRSGEEIDLHAGVVINAAGSWSGRVAQLAGVRVSVQPDRGCLIAFNHRFSERVVNRLHKSSDGDIFVPHGSITILGTSSFKTDDPADRRVSTDEVLRLITIGRSVFPDIDQYRILRVFAGTRPLYTPEDSQGGRSASRNFVVLDHSRQGVEGFISVCGGKFTTYRLMAEKAVDLACRKLGNTAVCRTADEALMQNIDPEIRKRARPFFLSQGLDLAVSRLGDGFVSALHRMEQSPWKKSLICECEMVTFGEFEEMASESSSYTINDIRRRTRLGMGTCQGTFCGLRAVGRLVENGFITSAPQELLRNFSEERWHGVKPVLWGTEVKEQILTRGIYSATLNIDGPGFEEPEHA